MPTETEHRIKIKADARDAKAATRDIEQGLRTLTNRQIALNRELLNTKRGTDEYKRLKDELKGVNERVGQATAAMAAYNRQVSETVKAERELARLRRQSFVGGLASGAGLAQFMPAGPGMYPRIAGAAIGRMGRRAVGGAAAPFMTPGLGGLMQAAQALPGGQAVAGALQTAAGFFQQAVGFDRARMAAMPFAGGPGVFGMGAARARAGAIMAEGRRAAALRGGPSMIHNVPFRDASGGIVMGGGGPLTDAQLAGMPDNDLGVKLAGAPGTTSVPETMVQRDPRTGKPIGIGRDPAAERVVAERQRRIMAPFRRRAAAETAVQLPGAGFGVRFGVGPQEMMQALSGMMQARGGVFSAQARGQFEEALAARVGFGVSAEQAGGFARAGMAGGGARGGMGLSTVLQSAVAQGLQGSRVTEYLQQMVGLAQQAERTGVKINFQDMTRQSAMLTAGGIAAPQAARIAGGLTRQAMGVAEQGVSGPADLAMLMAFGFNPAQGPEGYAKAIARAEGGMTPEALQNVLRMASQATEGIQDPTLRALMVKRMFGRGFKTSIGMGQASAILDMYRGGAPREEVFARMQQMIGEGERAGARGRLIEGAAGRARGAGLAVRAAGLEADAIQRGKQMQEIFINLEDAGRKAADIVKGLQRPLVAVTQAVKDFTEAATKMLEGLRLGPKVGGSKPPTVRRGR